MGDRVDRTWGRALGPWRDKVMCPAPRIVYQPDLEPVQPPAPIGHNGGPPLDPPVNNAYVRFMWKRAHAAVWRTPPRDIALFRLARARAAGVDYRTYMLELLDTGRRLQSGDVTPPGSCAREPSAESQIAANDQSGDPGEDAG